MFEPRERASHARLYLVCGEASHDFLEAAIRGGVDLVQLRLKEHGDEEILAAAARVKSICARHGVPFILNDRTDLAVAAGADGVHLGQDDMPVVQAREVMGQDAVVGLSTHSPEQIERAGALGVDYIGVGPVFETPTKPGRAAVGLELVRYAARAATVPFFAIGGIDVGTVEAVRAAGARRVAVVRALTQAPDPEALARALRAAIGAENRVGAT